MSSPILISESTLTDRYQTTVPDSVRQALHLKKREKIRYTIKPGGEVVLSRADQNDDPVLDGFLSFLARDIANNPEHVTAMTTRLADRMQSLVANVEFDVNSPLSEEDD